MPSDQRELATAELFGALAYSQLRSFEVTARAVRVAPDARIADRLAEFAIREHGAYRLLSDHLVKLTELPTRVLDRHKPHIDAYFDAVPVENWWSMAAFLTFGLPLVADFANELAPVLDAVAGEVLLDALADRDDFTAFAVEELKRQLGDDKDRERTRVLVGDLLGRALTRFQNVMSETDALRVLLAGEEDGGAIIRRLAVRVIEAHRLRMMDIGLDDLL